jgi:membrane protease YdiL (CAAX protease family)
MNKTIRNILIVALFTVGGGWLGLWLNHVTGNTQPPLQSLGALVWLVSPALAGVLLRAFGGDGWKDAGFGLNLRGGWKWYVVSILAYPVAALVSFGIARAVGAIRAEGFAVQGWGAYFSAVGVITAGSLMKNIFEEFAWRGYLTPRLEAAKVPAFLNHLIVGILWWAWHLPYYYYFLDRSLLDAYLTTIRLNTFIFLAIVALFPTAILFGELRLISKSVWPVFILHNLINGLSMPLILNRFITLNGGAGVIFTPSNDGLFTSILLGVIGVWLYRQRTRPSGK